MCNAEVADILHKRASKRGERCQRWNKLLHVSSVDLHPVVIAPRMAGMCEGPAPSLTSPPFRETSRPLLAAPLLQHVADENHQQGPCLRSRLSARAT